MVHRGDEGNEEFVLPRLSFQKSTIGDDSRLNYFRRSNIDRAFKTDVVSLSLLRREEKMDDQSKRTQSMRFPITAQAAGSDH